MHKTLIQQVITRRGYPGARNMKYRLCLFLIAAAVFARLASASTLVQMRTDMGNIDIVLFEEIAPKTVQNFIDYMNKGPLDGYDGTYIHRSVFGFAVQGGGYIFDPADGDFVSGGISQIPQDPPIANEAGLPGALSNVRGTLAMAKQANDPDSAKSEWFFNQVNNNDPSNPDNLDEQNGGFTVFGSTTESGILVVDQITLLPICYDLIPAPFCDAITPPSGFTPFIDLDPAQPVQPENLVKLNLVSTAVADDSDGDGVSDALEAGAPGGDGNDDGTPDSQQAHVASLPGTRGEYITIAITAVNGVPVAGATPAARLDSVFVLGPSFLLATKAGNELAGFNFAHGFTGFNVVGANIDDSVNTAVVQLTLPARQSPDQYFQYGPTLDNPAPHWHKFTFDGQTGADFPGGNKMDLHFVDGGPGDSRLGIQDGEIRDPSAGAIAFKAPNTSGGGGGSSGCSLRHSDAGIMQAGEWLVLFFMAVMMRLHHARTRKTRMGTR